VEDAATDAEGRVRIPESDVYVVSFIPPGEAPPQEGVGFSRVRYGIALPGALLVDEHPNPHFFHPGRLRLARAAAGAPPFGFAPSDSASVLALVPFPEGFALRRGQAGTMLVPQE
jgi:hypothetical protein